MRKCPHCGENMSEDQEVCFACGSHVRERGHRVERPHNPLVFVLVGALVLAVIVGGIVMIGGRAKRAAAEAQRQKQAQIEEAARAAAQATRDSTREADRIDATDMLNREVNELESRFELVRRQVVRGQPGPEQAKLISQISAEVAGLHQLVATFPSQPGAAADSVTAQLRDGERTVRTLISGLSRAPKQ